MGRNECQCVEENEKRFKSVSQDVRTFIDRGLIVHISRIDDEELDEEDLDLLEENTGLKLSRREVKVMMKKREICDLTRI